jgi:hypothetical protein
MRWWTASCFALPALALCTLAAPAPARAAQPSVAVAAGAASDTPTRTGGKRPRVRALEAQGVVMTQLLPRPAFGADLAFVFGHPNFQARVGALVLGVPPWHLGMGQIANVLQVGTLDLCAAKQVLRNQIRMCMGGQAGGMAHRWQGYDRPGRSFTVWAAGTLKGDYQLQLTQRLGVIGSVGMVIPVVGPSFQTQDSHGSNSALVFPGPMAAFVSLGTTFRW